MIWTQITWDVCVEPDHVGSEDCVDESIKVMVGLLDKIIRFRFQERGRK